MIVTRALLAALALCAACASLSGSEEDVWYYKGKTQAEWAEELKKSKNEEAWKAFDRFGRHGAYELLQLIQQGDAQCRERALSKIRPDYLSVPKNQDLVKSFLRDENPAVRKAGIQLLAPLVAKDEQWIMHLNDLRKDANGEVAAAAEQALKPVMSKILFND
ncbi:MAG TPA: hypothetical protein VEK08_21505, partial [Planctomycetota bacterium]|nr:hypothetical protein [Planctomycetota bacterium]